MALKLVTDLASSPIVRAFAIYSASVALLFWLLGWKVMNNLLDVFAIVGCILLVYRFSNYAATGLRERNPRGSQVLVIGVCMIAIGVGGLRLLREIGLELGILSSPAVAYTFGALTAVMVFAIYMKVAAPQITLGNRAVGHMTFLYIAMAVGAAITGLLFVLRVYL